MTIHKEDRELLLWRVADRPAYHREPYGPSWREQAPVVRVAPTTFEVADIPGRMGTWDDFGRWYHRLKADRDELPAESARKMHRLVDGGATKRDSVRRLYRHLQKESRYVSVQLGIGGWQPFPASYVEERGYGDCKALTNYLEASLEAVGIPAHPVLIYRGMDPRPLQADFPSSQFNHVVLAVPMAQDTLWLENTDTTAPFGHVAADIEDRYGLMVTPEGGELVRTPASRPLDNRQTRTATVALTPNGSGEASIHTTYTGNQQDRVRRHLTDESPRKRREWVRERLDIASFDLQTVDFADVDAYRDTVSLPIQLDLPRYASKTGSRLFLPLNLTQRWEGVPSEMDAPRTQSIHAVPYPFVDVDSIRYELPEGYDVEATPEPVSVETDFATYEATVTREEGALVYRRRLEWRTKTLAPEQYEAFRSFRQEIARADQAQAVLVKEKT
jgi:transglutaminase-like putative cysteine protease